MATGPPYVVLFHHDFPKDLEQLPRNLTARVLKADEDRLSQAPDRYGERLRQSLHGFWKLRVGDLRVVYEIVGRQVRVYGVKVRRDVYQEITRRTSRGWSPPELGTRG